MEIIGLIFEILFLALGVYLYLFATGRLRVKDPELQKKAETFRRHNAWWLRIGGLALTAIMLINLLIHLRQLIP